MTDPQNFIDRMLEVENLTDSLEDEDADYFLNWGIAKLKEQLEKTDDNDAAGEYTNDLMCFMRTLNQIAGNLEYIQPEELAELAACRQRALGSEQGLTKARFGDAATILKTMAQRQAVEYLLQTILEEG